MGRPKKQGLDYFPFDVDFFSHPKIEALHTRYGNNGVAIYLYILCEAYRREGYYLRMDDDVMDQMMKRITRKEGTIKQVLEFLCSRSLLTKLSILETSDTFYTSPGIQLRYQEVAKGLRRDVYVNKDLWILKEEETANCIKFTLFSDSSSKNDSKSSKNDSKSSKNNTNEMKGNEMKVNEGVVAGELTRSEYEELIMRYGEAVIQDYITRTLLYKQCNKSTIERWIKEDAGKRQRKNQFNNFHQREYSEEMFREIERRAVDGT